MNRRSLLGSTVLAVTGLPLKWPRSIGVALADDKNWQHGVSLFGDLKYPTGFRHFDYVNADAPKGGIVREAASGTFDNFNGVVAGVKGSLAAGIDLIHETLLVSSLDEISAGYGLLAEAVSFPADFSSVTYRLREQAKWHDGTPIAPGDVIFFVRGSQKIQPAALGLLSSCHQSGKDQRSRGYIHRGRVWQSRIGADHRRAHRSAQEMVGGYRPERHEAQYRRNHP